MNKEDKNNHIVTILCIPSEGEGVCNYTLHYNTGVKRVIDAYFKENTNQGYTSIMYCRESIIRGWLWCTVTPVFGYNVALKKVHFTVELDNLKWGKYWRKCIFQNVPK